MRLKGETVFRERKALEAVSYILERIPEGPRTEYLKVVKLLYLGDRQLMQDRGRTITGDQMNALKNGPILSTTLDLLEGDNDGWSDYIRNPEKYVVELVQPAPPAALSRADMRALDVVLKEHGSKNWRELIEFTHELPEWINKGIGKGRRWAIIEVRELAEALGYNDEEAEAIVALEHERAENPTLMQDLGAKPGHV